MQCEIAFTGVDGALVFHEEVPPQDKWVHQIPYDPYTHTKMTALDAEGDVDDADGVHLATVDADRVAFERADDVVIKFGVATQKAFTHAGSFASRVTEGGLFLIVNIH